MKRTRKTVLSSSQKKKLFRIAVSIFILTILWVVFAPGRGILYLHRQKRYLAEIKAKQEQLSLENMRMEQDIQQLLSDKEYLERVAREDYGMVKDNEIIFNFAKEKKKKKKKKNED